MPPELPPNRLDTVTELTPTQLASVALVQAAAKTFVEAIDVALPDGDMTSLTWLDKQLAVRAVEDAFFRAVHTITRHPVITHQPRHRLTEAGRELLGGGADHARAAI